MSRIGEAGLMALADALVSSGAAAVGYTWFNLDDGFIGGRSTSGELFCDRAAFPSGTLAPLAAHVNALGLQLGAYTDRGVKTCEGRPGSFGYEARDAATFVSWGVAWLKEDSCSSSGDFSVAHDEYGAMAAGLRATGKDVFFSLCGWWSGFASFSAMSPPVGDAWRIATDTGDLEWPRWLVNVEAAAAVSGFVGPLRGWPDVDMVGGHSSIDAERHHLSFIALIGAPLLLSFNVSDAERPPTLGLAVYLNPELLAIHSDDAAPAVAARGRYYARVAGGAVTGPLSSSSAALPVDTLAECASPEAAWQWTPSASSPGYGSLEATAAPGWCLALWDEWSGACIDALAAQLVPCNSTALGCPLAAQQWAWAPAGNASTLTSALSEGGGTPLPSPPLLTAIGRVPGALYVQSPLTDAAALTQAWEAAAAAAPGAASSTTVRSALTGECLGAPAVSTTNVWARWLANGDVALLFFNVGLTAAPVECDAACLSASLGGGRWAARDVWAHTDAGIVDAASGYKTQPLPPIGGSLLLRLSLLA